MTRVITWSVSLCLWLLSWGVAYGGSPTAFELVRDSLSAPYFWDFSGTQVIVAWNPSGSSSSNTVKVAHRKSGVTLVRYLNGNGRVVQDDGKYIRQYEPGYKMLLVDHRPPMPKPSTLFRLLVRSHRMVLAGTDRVCGRKAYVVLIIPRVPGNPWRKCWIDYYTKYTLKNEQYGPDWPKAQPQSFMFWSSISFKRVSAAAVRLDVPKGTRVVTKPAGQLVVSLDQAQRMVGFRVLMPANPPPGYVYDGATVVQVGSARAVHLRFTNGLNAISLFQSAGPMQAGALASGFSQAITWRQGRINIALVGNVSRSELAAIQRQIGAGAERDGISEVVRLTGASRDEVSRLRDYGYGFSDIAVALMACRHPYQDPAVVLRLHSYGFSWEELSQRYNFDLQSIRRRLSALPD